MLFILPRLVAGGSAGDHLGATARYFGNWPHCSREVFDLRIIGGTCKGFPLITAKGLNTRPTTDRIREAIFNVLQGQLSGAKVLDLFAGSGALALEALSRGAQSALLIEKGSAAQRAILTNIEKCALPHCQLLKGNALSLATQLSALALAPIYTPPYDIIFLDPPYNQGLVIAALERIAQAALLAPRGIIVCEMSSRAIEPTPDLLSDIGLCLNQEKVYGDTAIHYLSHQDHF